MELVLDNVELKPGDDERELVSVISRKWGIHYDFDFRILRKSLDARNKERIVYRYKILVDFPDEIAADLMDKGDVTRFKAREMPSVVRNLEGLRIAIVGSGPAGLFCALRLIGSGAFVDIFERGKPVEDRLKDIRLLREGGILDHNSNVLFGEGGAGTYSDGKLTTRINRVEEKWFFRKMVELGAPESILYEAKPHIGTDRLVAIIKSIRETILSRGFRIHFNEKLVDIIKRGNRVEGIVTSSGEEYRSSVVVLAIGHSARDTYEMLSRRGIALERKDFAVGLRVEHPAELINYIQYGSLALKKILPAADYRLAFNNRNTGRGVYTFCMCPGGEVINSSSEDLRLCTNGMSYSKRELPHSNAAIVVSVKGDDIEGNELAGVAFQRRIEERIYQGGGGSFIAPAQTITSFLNDRIDNSIPEVSYMPGVKPSLMKSYLPEWVVDEIKMALYNFNRKMKGFISSQGVLIGAETRTSSPLRIIRDDNCQSPSAGGLFPVGEGAGYAGGIVSSAVDGIRAADRIAELFEKGDL